MARKKLSRKSAIRLQVADAAGKLAHAAWDAIVKKAKPGDNDPPEPDQQAIAAEAMERMIATYSAAVTLKAAAPLQLKRPALKALRRELPAKFAKKKKKHGTKPNTADA